MKNLLVRFVHEDAGQDLIEYAILVGLITVGTMIAVTAIGTKVGSIFTNFNTELQKVN